MRADGTTRFPRRNARYVWHLGPMSHASPRSVRLCAWIARLGAALIILGAAPLAAEEGDGTQGWTLRGAAEAARTAAAAKDEAALKALLGDEAAPSPWLLAEYLCLRGDPAIARTFVAQADDPALKAYVEGRGEAARPETASALAAVWQARQGDSLEGAGDAIRLLLRSDGAAKAYGRMCDVRRLREQRKILEAAARLPAVADAYQALGWTSGAFHALYLGGRSLAETSQFDKAMATFAEARELAKKAQHAQHELDAVQALANVAAIQRDMPRLMHWAKVCLALATKLDASVSMALAHSHLADALSTVGKRAEAEVHLETALKIAEPLGNDRLTATLLSDLGTQQKEAGKYADAIATYERVESLVQGDPHNEAVVTLSLGQLYRLVRNPERAMKYLHQAREAFLALRDGNSAANASSSLGDMYSLKGDRKIARKLYNDAAQIYQAVGNRVGSVEARIKISKIDFQEGKVQRALDAFVALRPEAVALSRPTLTTTLDFRIARALFKLKRYEEALAKYELVREQANELNFHDLVLHCEADRATIWCEQGEYARVIETMPRVLDGVDRMYASLSDEENASARSGYTSMFDVGIAAAIGAQNPAALMMFLERARAGALQATLGSLEALREAEMPRALRDAEDIARRELQAAREARARARREGDRDAYRAARKQLLKAEAAHLAVVGRIQREARKLAGVLYPRPVTLAEAQASLAPGHMLLYLGVIDARGYALQITADQARISDVSREALAEAQQAVFHDPTDAKAVERVARIRSLLIAALGVPKAVSHLVVSPADVFTHLPYAALLPERSVSLAPSATVLRVLADKRPTKRAAVLALGDPEYAAALSRLPGTRVEAKAVGSTVLLGADATRAGLLKALRPPAAWRAVHFACHGLIDAERPARSTLALSPADGDSGRLSALDVVGLPLTTDLAVLSACETARGKLVRSEGLVGFPRAFLLAGGTPRALFPVEGR